VLGVAQVPDDATFFDSGGDSLRLVVLVEKLNLAPRGADDREPRVRVAEVDAVSGLGFGHGIPPRGGRGRARCAAVR
ncbi:acyl carrier protein, partial [Saccharothrix sp. MB29]|nr:acyl carrier protein [Saccharothrix sp. MB29]